MVDLGVLDCLDEDIRDYKRRGLVYYILNCPFADGEMFAVIPNERHAFSFPDVVCFTIDEIAHLVSMPANPETMEHARWVYQFKKMAGGFIAFPEDA